MVVLAVIWRRCVGKTFGEDRVENFQGLRAILRSGPVVDDRNQFGVDGEALRIRLRDLSAGTSTTGVVAGDLSRLEGWVEQALYGMAGEAISNAIRHGHATHVTVSLREARGRAIIVVVDDGRGFEPATIARRRGDQGLGLLGMTRQARWLGGLLDLASRPEAGTQLRISIPL